MKHLAIVTGASKGIGQAIATTLASEELGVICIAKSDQNGLMETVEHIRNKGFFAHPILCDISDPQASKELFREISLLETPIEYLINNAGISLYRLFTHTSHSDFMHVINTNLTSVFNMCKESVPLMLQQQRGHILNISSIWGNEGAAMEVAYSASKGGVNSFTKALAKELGLNGIRVNAIACGVIQTTMNSFLNEEEERELSDSISMGRYGTTEEVALFVKSILFGSPYLNGQIITYDGGRY